MLKKNMDKVLLVQKAISNLYTHRNTWVTIEIIRIVNNYLNSALKVSKIVS